ncbi:hypothetical protein PSACC_00317 [Paramicrosporidium saccamoebae]|uniref:Uncharacterized protein n=1 Tax=Paramicrosporidium saccamoebae TaxID=1246581 RepID=A0A2H9TQ60_9FUNG|nr:hypothetical protein PSACC_00317 [Paramicrosporidium saccamoebae]
MSLSLSEVDEFMGNVWKRLAAEDEKPNESNFEFSKFMTLIKCDACTVFLLIVSAVYGEMRVILDVLDGVSSSGPLSTVEIPTASVPPVAMTKCRPDVAKVAETLRKEAARLRDSLVSQEKFLTSNVIPLKSGGWRLTRNRDNWLVDAGISQILHPVYPKSPLQLTGVIDCNGQIMIPRISELMMLTVNGGTLPLPSLQDDRELSLFKAQISQISKLLYGTLLEAVRKRPELFVICSSSFDFTIKRPELGDICILLQPFSACEIVNDKVRDLFAGFLQKTRSADLLDLLIT